MVTSAPLCPFEDLSRRVGGVRGLNIEEEIRAQPRRLGREDLRRQYVVVEPKHIACGIVVAGLFIGGITIGAMEAAKNGGISWGSNSQNGTNSFW